MTLVRKGVKAALLLLPPLFFGVFYLYPVASLFRLSWARASLTAVAVLWQDPYYAHLLWFTTWQAALSTALTILLAFPGAYLFAHYDFWGKQSWRALSTLPFVLPTVVVANAFTALLGPRGWANDLLLRTGWWDTPPIQWQHSLGMILLAHVFYNYAVALRIMSSYWQNISPELRQAAAMLGASPWQSFRRVTWPLLRPAVTGAAILIFTFTFTSFGVILILGGPRFATLEVEIYRQAVQLFNLPLAAALSLGQILFTLGLMGWYTRWQSEATAVVPLRATGATSRPIRNWRDRLWLYANLGLMALLLGAPLFALVSRSFWSTTGWTTLYYRALFTNSHDALFFVPPITAVRNSLLLALTTMGMALVLGGLIVALITAVPHWPTRWQRWGRWLDPLFMLPLATSPVTLGFGYIIALNKPPLALRQSLLLVPIAHTLVAVPFVVRSLLPAVRRLNGRWHEAAALLGANPRQVWWQVTWPLVRPALVAGGVFAFTISMGEFGATVFIARPQTPTLPVAIFRFLGQPGALNYGQALAMSALLMGVCAAGFILIERFRLGDEGAF